MIIYVAFLMIFPSAIAALWP